MRVVLCPCCRALAVLSAWSRVCVLSACDLFRANGARLPAWPPCASFRPLDNLQVSLGAKSCASRLNPKGSAPLAGAKEVAVTPSEFAAGRPSPAYPRALASGPVRRGDAPAVRRAVRVARPRRRIRLLVPLASRIGGPTNRLAASHSASRSASPPLANAQSLRRYRGLPLASRKRNLPEEQAERPSVELSKAGRAGSRASRRSAADGEERYSATKQGAAIRRWGTREARHDARERDRGLEDRDELDQGDKRGRFGETRAAAERGRGQRLRTATRRRTRVRRGVARTSRWTGREGEPAAPNRTHVDKTHTHIHTRTPHTSTLSRRGHPQ